MQLQLSGILLKAKVGAIILFMMGLMCLIMFVIFLQFQSSKPTEQAQPVLTYDQAMKGIGNFVNDTSSVIKQPVPKIGP